MTGKPTPKTTPAPVKRRDTWASGGPYRDPYSGEQLRFYRWLPPHMRPSMFEHRKRRGPPITAEAIAIAAILLAIPIGFLLGYFGLFR